MWEGNNHDDKCMQVAKYEFMSQREDNYGEMIMHKISVKNITTFEQSR